MQCETVKICTTFIVELSREDSVSKHISEGNIEVAFDVLRSGPVQERQCLWSHLKR